MKSLPSPVARHFRHRPAFGIHDGISQQDERQMLPVVRWRALLPIPDGNERAAIPHTCSAYAASCVRNSSAQPDRRADVRRREIAMPAERGLCRPLQRQALRRNAEDITASRNWSDVSCFRIPAIPMSILTGRELEFLASLNGSWARLYRNELARLLHKVDDRCDAHHETHSIIRISAAPSSRSRRNSATTTKT